MAAPAYARHQHVSQPATPGLRIVAPAPNADFARDVARGLRAPRKQLSPKYFYDDAGCALFERITTLPEYYPTRTEIGILRDNAAAIGAFFLPDSALIEFGAGKSTKARVLLDAVSTISAYIPVDIAGAFLHAEADAVRRDLPRLLVEPVVADFTQVFALPESIRSRPRIGFFPGSTIGNFEPYEACGFLRRAGEVLGDDAVLIVGVDAVKDIRVLTAAYNDAQGVTAAFNRNLLTRINRELGGTFEPARFEHHAVFNRERSRIEMHLASTKRQKVRIGGDVIEFRAGETIHTESSYKYSVESFRALARGAGWSPAAVWSDAARYFNVHALRRETPAHHG